MRKLFTKIKAYLYRDALAAHALRESVQELQKAVEELTRSTKKTESTVAKQQAVLSDVLSNVRYLATSESKALQRAGHPHDF